MRRYPDAVLWDEIGYLAYQLHWSLDDLLDLDHRQRRRLLGIVARFDRRARTGGDAPVPTPR